MNWLTALAQLPKILTAILQELKAHNQIFSELKEQLRMDFTKLNEGVRNVANGLDDIAGGITEVAGEIKALQEKLAGNDEAQAQLDSIGERLTALGEDAKAKGQALRDIIPEAPPEPPAE